MGQYNSGQNPNTSSVIVGTEGSSSEENDRKTATRVVDIETITLLQDILTTLRKIEMHLSMVTEDEILDEDII